VSLSRIPHIPGLPPPSISRCWVVSPSSLSLSPDSSRSVQERPNDCALLVQSRTLLDQCPSSSVDDSTRLDLRVHLAGERSTLALDQRPSSCASESPLHIHTRRPAGGRRVTTSTTLPAALASSRHGSWARRETTPSSKAEARLVNLRGCLIW
jgi:hypothetical protein